jgi:hypothetical protein
VRSEKQEAVQLQMIETEMQEVEVFYAMVRYVTSLVSTAAEGNYSDVRYLTLCIDVPQV